MIKPKCDKCGEELRAYGGLAFSPPETLHDDSPSRQVDKLHICVNCWGLFMNWMKNGAPGREERLEDLLRSAHAIAQRGGVGTAWSRFIASVQAEGVGSITARTYRTLPSDEDAGESAPEDKRKHPGVNAVEKDTAWQPQDTWIGGEGGDH